MNLITTNHAPSVAAIPLRKYGGAGGEGSNRRRLEVTKQNQLNEGLEQQAELAAMVFE